MRHLPVREVIADPGVEINAFGESAAKGVGDLRRDFGIDVAPAGGELDPEVLVRLVVHEPANDARGHTLVTLQAASGAASFERPFPSAAAIPPSARTAP